jgi:hypothetical protein
MTTNYPDGSTAASSGDDVGTSSTGSQGTGSGGAGEKAAAAKEQAKQAAGTAAEESRHVAGVAQGEASRVASEARSQVQSLVGQASSQVEDQSRTQLGRLAEVLGSWAEDLDKMASSSEGPASGLAHEAADRVQGLAAGLEGREPREVLEDVRSFARRRPGLFLGGALVAGVVAGRLTRGAKAAHDDHHDDRGASSGTSGGSRLGVSSQTGPDGFAYQSGGTTAEPYVEPASSLPNPAASVAGDASYGYTSTGEPLGGRP